MPRIGVANSWLGQSLGMALLALLCCCFSAVPANSQDSPVREELEIASSRLMENERLGDRFEIRVLLKKKSADRFAQFTRLNVGKYVVLFAGKERVIRARLMAPIENGEIAIHFNFDLERAERVLKGLQRPGSKIVAVVDEKP